MVVKMTLLITAVLKGKQVFKSAAAGLASVAASAAAAGVALAAAAAVGITAFLVKTTQKAAEFSDQMMAVKAATGATTQQFEELNDKAREIGRTMGKFTAADAAEGMRILAFAGFSVEENLTAIDDVMKLSQAGMIDLGDAADAVAGSLRSFGFEATETGRVVDTMVKTFTSANTTMGELADAIKYVGPVAASAGIEFEELNATLGILANANIKGSQAGTNLRNIIIRLQAPSAEATQTLAELGVSIFELPPAAQRAQTALERDVTTLKRLEQQMDETGAASQALQMQLQGLAIEEAQNNLEIMKIRDAAADQNRELTAEEMERIDELEAANRDLSISQAELSIQTDKLDLEEQKLNASIEQTKESIQTNTDALNSNKGSLKSISDVAKEFTTATENLSDAQETEALATIFGIRNIAAFQVIMRAANDETAGTQQTIAEFTETLQNAAGTADEVSATMEQGLGNQILQMKSAFEAFQLDVADAFQPALVNLLDVVKNQLIPSLEPLAPVLASVVVEFGAIVQAIAPTIDKLIEAYAASGNLENVMGALKAIVTSLMPAFEAIIPLFEVGSNLMKSLTPALESVGKIFQALAPLIEAVVGIMLELMPIFDALSPIIDAVSMVVGVLVDLLVILLTPIQSLIQIIVAFLVPVLDTVAQIVQVVATLLEGLTPVFEAVAMVIDAILPLIETLLGVIEMLLPVILVIVQVFVDAFIPVFEIIALVIIALLPIIEALVEIIIALMPVVEALIPLIEALAPLFFIQITMLQLLIPLFEILIPVIEALAYLLTLILVPIIEALVFILVPLIQGLTWLIDVLVTVSLYFTEWSNILEILMVYLDWVQIAWGFLVDAFLWGIDILMAPFDMWISVFETIWGWIETIIDGIESVTDKISGVTDIVGGVAGGVTDFFGFQEGGVVPGKLGEPVMGLLHGQEEVLTPEQRSQRGGFTYNSSDTMNVTIQAQGPLDEFEIKRISKALADQYVKDKRQAIQSKLAEAT